MWIKINRLFIRTIHRPQPVENFVNRAVIFVDAGPVKPVISIFFKITAL
jgi:hypothetical protein